MKREAKDTTFIELMNIRNLDAYYSISFRLKN